MGNNEAINFYNFTYVRWSSVVCNLKKKLFLKKIEIAPIPIKSTPLTSMVPYEFVGE